MYFFKKHSIIPFVLLLGFISLSPTLASASEEYIVNINRVVDGDTVIFEYKGETYKGRLAFIDAPESNQPFGKDSTEFLSNLILNKDVKIKMFGIDNPDYNRHLIEIYNIDPEINVNLFLVNTGHAWWYEAYAKDKKEFKIAQDYSQRNKIGLWALKDPIDPEEWRIKWKYGIVHSDKPECKTDKIIKCSMLKTCKEAKFWFETCGVLSLDKNSDGLPCETLCKDIY